jgi:GAF domain-containing protein
MADSQPVFEAIVQNLRRLFNTPYAVVALIEGDEFVLKAIAGDERFTSVVRSAYPRPVLDPRMVAHRAIRSGQVVQIASIATDPDAPAATAELARTIGYDAILVAPLMRGGAAIGFIVTSRVEPGPFDEKHVALIKSFADQAVIAIENARLFNETKEALEQQTATADILKVISSSTTDTQPVFEAIVKSATALFKPWNAAILMREGERLVR